MCGLSGFSGVADKNTRHALALALGMSIDSRGRDACGYVTLPSASSGKDAVVAKTMGSFGDAKARFIYGAAKGEVCMMHSRFATCGSNTVGNAHPFVIKRQGKTVLIGAHNGMLSGTQASAKEHKRDHTVDSRELFELLADGHLDQIAKLTGYGVITYVVPDSGMVHMVRLNESSDIVVASLVGGGMVWCSTKRLLEDALDAAGLKIATYYDVEKVGNLYHIGPTIVYDMGVAGAKVADRISYGDDWSTYARSRGLYSTAQRTLRIGSSYYDDTEEWDGDYLARGQWVNRNNRPDQECWEAWVADSRSKLGYPEFRRAWNEAKEAEEGPVSSHNPYPSISGSLLARDTEPMVRVSVSSGSDSVEEALSTYTDDELERMSDEELDRIIDQHIARGDLLEAGE